MNILFLNAKKNWAGIITWNISLYRKLTSKGHNCFIITGKISALAENQPEGVDLVRIKFGMNYNPATIFYLTKFIRKNSIDIIVVNIKKEVIFGGIAGSLTKKPVVRLIGNEKDFYSGVFLEKHFVTKDIFPCEYTRQLSHDRFKWLKSEKTIAIHTGKDIPVFAEDDIKRKRESFGASKDDIVIGIMDRLDKNKGIQILIQAYAKLCRKHNNIKLVIAGKGSYGPELKRSAEELDISERIFFAGFVNDVMLTARAFDIAVLASFFESFPNTVVEYMASNTAVIATDVGGVSELVKDGHNGFLIEKENTELLQNKLELLVTDEITRSKFARNALQTIKDGFTEEIMSERTIEFFREIGHR